MHLHYWLKTCLHCLSIEYPASHQQYWTIDIECTRSTIATAPFCYCPFTSYILFNQMEAALFFGHYEFFSIKWKHFPLLEWCDTANSSIVMVHLVVWMFSEFKKSNKKPTKKLCACLFSFFFSCTRKHSCSFKLRTRFFNSSQCIRVYIFYSPRNFRLMLFSG